MSHAWSIRSSAAEAALAEGVLFRHVLIGWVVLRFVKLVGTLRIHLREVMCSCTMMLLPLSCLA